MQINLIFLKKDGTVSSFPLPSSVTVIGRRQDCDFCIPLMVISRRHCEINTDQSKVTIRDLKSRNGTFVNDQKIEEAVMKVGDTLKLGPVEFVLQVDGTPDNFDDYFAKRYQKLPETSGEIAHSDETQDADFDDIGMDLSDVDLGQSHQTELIADLPDDFDFDDDLEMGRPSV